MKKQKKIDRRNREELFQFAVSKILEETYLNILIYELIKKN